MPNTGLPPPDRPDPTKPARLEVFTPDVPGREPKREPAPRYVSGRALRGSAVTEAVLRGTMYLIQRS